MKYLQKRFTVTMGSPDYRKNYDKIDWGTTPECTCYGNLAPCARCDAKASDAENPKSA